jgi:hypothetical protein
LGHGQFFVLEHQLLDGGQGVDQRAVTHKFEVTEVDTAFDHRRVDILAFLHAQVVQGRAQRPGEVLGPEVDNDMLLYKGMLEEIDMLGADRRFQNSSQGFEAARIAGFQTDTSSP